MASRTKKSAINIITAFGSQFLGQASSFIVRTIFIRVLATEYLGINGLFTNILQMLSLAELGVSAALIYSMYKPMAEKNEYVISMYMGLYRRIYSIIGFVVLIVGFLLVPFLDFFITSRPEIPENLELIYCFKNSIHIFFCIQAIGISGGSKKLYYIKKFAIVYNLAICS